MFILKIEPSETLHTEFGNAKFYNKGYSITSRKEGNMNKKLHRLIYEKFYNVTLPEEIDIHHKDYNPKNNCILNLEALTHDEHTSLHHKGMPMPNHVKEKLRQANIGKPPSPLNKEALRKANLGNKYNYKDYPRIVKSGFQNGKQMYALKYQGKRIMRSTDLRFLEKELYKLEQRRKNNGCEKKKQ